MNAGFENFVEPAMDGLRHFITFFILSFFSYAIGVR